jgi:hypothetical protein
MKLLENNIDAVFLFPKWPETFSLVTTEAISAGAFILTNSKSGNIQDLVSNYNSGKVFEDLNEVEAFLEDESNFPTGSTQFQAKLTGLCTSLPMRNKS